MKFRMLQGLTGSTMFLMWLVKTLTHPKLHLTMLVMTVVVLGVSEVSYRAGRASRRNAL